MLKKPHGENMAEFDRYVRDYQAMLNESLAPLGGFNEYYSRQKIALLGKSIQKNIIRSVLDFGCGLGNTTQMLQETFKNAHVVGADISEVSIKQARLLNPNIKFGYLADETFMATCIGAFDLIYVANVFHHVPPAERTDVMTILKNMLSPQGKVFFFEHNPYNPITKWVVSRCEFDKDAILLSPRESKQLFKTSGFQVSNPMFFLFFPHVLRDLSKVEAMLKWLPLGAQYCVAASL